MCAQPFLGLDIMLAYLSPSSPSPPLIPGFGVLERIIMGRRRRLKKSQFERNKALSNNFYVAPSPDYGVFVGVHIGYQTCVNFFARFKSHLTAPGLINGFFFCLSESKNIVVAGCLV